MTDESFSMFFVLGRLYRSLFFDKLFMVYAINDRRNERVEQNPLTGGWDIYLLGAQGEVFIEWVGSSGEPLPQLWTPAT